MTCPNCGLRMPFDRRAFRRGFLCGRCESELRISELYSRVLGIISLLVGFGLVWLPIVHGFGTVLLRSCIGFVMLLALGFPVAAVVLFLLVRLAPLVLSPRLVDGRSEPPYRLGLDGEMPSHGREDVRVRDSR